MKQSQVIIFIISKFNLNKIILTISIYNIIQNRIKTKLLINHIYIIYIISLTHKS